jgi:signal transduction histidine kinase
MQRMIRISMQITPIPGGLRWHELLIRGRPSEGRMLVSLRLPTGEWLNERVRVRRMTPLWSGGFLVSWAIMTLLAAALVLWAVRQFAAPLRRLVNAADQLGVDVNAPPLPEEGSAEAVAAAVAFNTMAARIRRFVNDRTFMLTAIGHDLRTPITRLKLRAEWMEDEEQQRKMLADLDELEGMVAATLAFGRADANAEAPAAIDLAELLRTILEEAQDARPHLADKCVYDGPAHLTVRARPVAIKRALTNLVLNALNYGGNAMVSAAPPRDGVVTVLVEDDGPGIPAGDLERVFEPFQRLEVSRNRETGGTGLGLPIARNILRAHGGDVVLTNRAKGGVKAVVTLPG